MKSSSLFAPSWLLVCFMGIGSAAEKPTLGSATIHAEQYPNLQAALDALPETGGIVKLPPGVFEINEPLLLSRSDARIEGSGASTLITNANQAGKPALVIRPPSPEKRPTPRLWRVQVGNLRLAGNARSGEGLLAQQVNEIYIHGLSVDHHGGDGIRLVDCLEDPRVVNSIITYNGKVGLNLVANHDIVVSANQFEDNEDALRCVDSYNLCMTGNNLDDHKRHGVIIENTYGSVLSGNMIEECNGTAVILDRDCYGITISANVIAHHLGGGVHLGDAWGCAISANTFTLVHSNSVLVSSNSGRITITGNNFSNSYKGDGDKRPAQHKNPMGTDAGTGILLQSTSGIVISGNLFSGLTTPAVQVEGKSQRLNVTGNVATDPRGAAKGRPAFHPGGAANSVFQNNIEP
jgi:hypothetical protein